MLTEHEKLTAMVAKLCPTDIKERVLHALNYFFEDLDEAVTELGGDPTGMTEADKLAFLDELDIDWVTDVYAQLEGDYATDEQAAAAPDSSQVAERFLAFIEDERAYEYYKGLF